MTDIKKVALKMDHKVNEPSHRAEYIEIACDRLLELGTKGISKTGAHSLFSDGAFNTTVSKIKTRHNISLSREFRIKTNKSGKKVRPMFYWIKNKKMACSVISLSNKFKLARNARPITTKLATILLSNFSE